MKSGILLLIFFVSVFPYLILGNDQQCLQDFLVTHPSIAAYFGWSTTTTNYCNSFGTVYCQNGLNITNLYLPIKSMAANEPPLDETFFNCLTSMKSFSLTNIPVVTDFLMKITPGSDFYTFSCNNCSIQVITQQPVLPVTTYISLQDEFQTILLSAIQYHQRLTISPLLASSMGPLITNDLDSSSYNTSNKLLSGWYFTSNYFPDLNNLYVAYLSFKMYSNSFDLTTLDNLKNASINSFSFDCSLLTPNTVVFPSQLILTKTPYTLATYGNFAAPQSYLDFSKLFQFIGSDLTYWNINGSIPLLKPSYYYMYLRNGNFSQWPTFTGSVDTLSITGFTNSVQMPASLTFSPTSYFDFSNNNISGTVSDSACEYIYKARMINNTLSGNMPRCMYCYWDYYSAKFSGNQFTNIPSSPCTTIDFNIYAAFNVTSNYIRYTINGTDLTFIQSNYAITPNIGSLIYAKNGQFYLDSTSLQTNLTMSASLAPLGFSLNRNVTLPAFSILNSVRTTTSYILTITGFPFLSAPSSVVIASTQSTMFSVLGSSRYLYTFTNLTPVKPVVSVTITNPSVMTVNYIINQTTGLANSQICSEDCISKNQLCDYSIGQCVDYVIYLTSVKECTESGGPIALYGNFGTSNNNLVVTINNNVCTSPVVTTNTLINCTLPAGSGRHDIILQQNGLTWNFTQAFRYRSLSLSCPLNCSNQGSCNQTIGECTCNSGFQGLDCSVPLWNTPPPTLSNTDDNGNTVISNGNTDFTIYLYSIREVSFSGVQVSEYLINQASMISYTLNDISYLYQSINGSNITLSYQTFSQTTPLQFGGVSFNVWKNSVKTGVRVGNWNYQNSLNTLQLVFKASGSTIAYLPNCSEIITSAATIQYQNLNQFSYFSLTQEGETLYGRFIDSVISDNIATSTSTSFSTESDSTLVAVVDLPHCISSCVIDPDFSIAVNTKETPSLGTNCDDLKCVGQFLDAHPSIANGYQLAKDSSGDYSLCGTEYVSCDINNGVIALNFSNPNITSQVGEPVVDSSLFNCLQDLETFNFYGIPLDSNILSSIAYPSTKFTCTDCSIQTINQPISLPTTCEIVLKDVLSSITLSSIQAVQSLTLQPLSQTGPLIVNDLTSNDFQPTNTLLDWSITSDNFPDLSNLQVNTFTFYISNSFNSSSYENIKKLSSADFSFYTDSIDRTFPIQLNSMTLTNGAQVYGRFVAPSSLIDISNLDHLSIQLSDSKFNYNKNIPFSKLPKSSFSFINGKLDVWPSIEFGNISTVQIKNSFSNLVSLPNSTISGTGQLDFSSNSISGSLPQLVCDSLYRLNLTNNQLSGELPSCAYCYSIFNDRLAGNQFTNTPAPACTTIKVNSISVKYIESSDSFFYSIVGTDLTYIPGNIGVESKEQVSFVSHNQYTFTSMNLTDTVTVTLNSPSLSLPATVTKVGPLVIYQTTAPLIDGTFTVTGFPFPSTISSVIVASNEAVAKGSINSVHNSYSIGSVGTRPSKSVVSMTFPTSSVNYIIDTTPGATNRLSCSESCIAKNQLCDYSIGTCVDYVISLSSVKECTENGGPITLYGDFGTSNNNLVVTINNNTCSSAVVTNSTQIDCTLPAGSGRYDIVLQQNGLTWTFAKSFKYQPLSFTCPLNCSNHGTCDNITGQCSCNSDYQGLSCSVPSSPSSSSSDGSGTSSPPTDSNTNDNGNTVISNGGTSFSVYLYSIREISYLGDQVKEYLFNQSKMTPSIVDDVQYLYQDIDGANLTLAYQRFNETTPYEFAGVTFNISKDSIKVSVSINNWGYDSSLNHLQVLFYSTSTTSYITDCEKVTTTKSKVSYQSLDQYSYYAMEQEGVTLQGRFIDRVLSDGRSTSISGEIVTDDSSSSTSVLVALNLPHCQSCLMDPDFSVLIDTSATPKSDSTSDGCGDSIKSTSSSSKKWKVPVIVVAVVLGSAIIIGVSYIVYKKYTTGRYMSNLKNKLNSLN